MSRPAIPRRRRSLRWLRLALIGTTVVVALVLGALAANRFAGPLPPRHLVISTSRVDGAYYAYALEYQKILASQGFTLAIETGPGSVATLKRLAAHEVTSASFRAARLRLTLPA